MKINRNLIPALVGVVIIVLSTSANAYLEKHPLLGQKAPEFSLMDYSGKLVSLSGLRGKVVLVVFWHPT